MNFSHFPRDFPPSKLFRLVEIVLSSRITFSHIFLLIFSEPKMNFLTLRKNMICFWTALALWSQLWDWTWTRLLQSALSVIIYHGLSRHRQGWSIQVQKRKFLDSFFFHVEHFGIYGNVLRMFIIKIEEIRFRSLIIVTWKRPKALDRDISWNILTRVAAESAAKEMGKAGCLILIPSVK